MHCRKMFKAEIPFSSVMTCEDDDKVGWPCSRVPALPSPHPSVLLVRSCCGQLHQPPPLMFHSLVNALWTWAALLSCRNLLLYFFPPQVDIPWIYVGEFELRSQMFKSVLRIFTHQMLYWLLLETPSPSVCTPRASVWCHHSTVLHLPWEHLCSLPLWLSYRDPLPWLSPSS